MKKKRKKSLMKDKKTMGYRCPTLVETPKGTFHW